ncbi:MAG TPA: AI-2E family transporter [Candidatus Kapabacteria bacterium]|nr:AI-2E family transporter [Candidatus Kapabacteria bacterium]
MSDTHEQQHHNIASGNFTPAAVLLFITGIAAFSLLLYTIHDLVHPFVICSLVVFIFYPLRRNTYARRMLWAAIVLTLGWGLYDVSGVLVPFIIAFVFAFLFDPVVSYAERFMPRWASALIIILVILGVIVLLGVFVVPPLFQQMGVLVHNISAIVASASDWLNRGGLTSLLDSFNIPQENVRTFVMDQLSPRLQSGLEEVLSALLSFVTGISGVLGQFLNAILIPIIGFYVLKDFPSFRLSMRRFLARVDSTNYLGGVLREVDSLLSAYLRGQALVATIIGTLAAILFMIFGIPFAIVLGVLVMLFDFVPFVGLIASMLVCICVVLFGASPTLGGVFAVVGIILALHAMESYVIAPRIIGKKVGLHPVVLILSLFVFGHLMGLLGMLVAVPSAAVITYLLRQWIEKGIGKIDTAKSE